MKLWQKDKTSLQAVEIFTVGQDREMDIFLAPFDVLGSIAHVKMLASIDLISNDELEIIIPALKDIYNLAQKGELTIQQEVEDIHSQIEILLTKKLGDVGKKIHSGRSRNDQVLVDIKLLLRSEIQKTIKSVLLLFELLLTKSEAHKNDLLPGYTHFQLAMPSSFGLWFAAYAESLIDDVVVMQSAYRVVNKNPLGSGAGYGSSFPLNRELTTKLLGFETLNYNVVYAQMGRGKTERIVANGLAMIASTLNKLATDACLFMNQNFTFIKFPDELTTGSSIMPHKKNPDVFEIIRARCNQLNALPNEITLLTTNLPSGYHRDMQITKELLFPAFTKLRSCIDMMRLMLSNVEVRKNILNDKQYKLLFSVEEVNKLVLAGMPFRDAYKKIGHDIESDQFNTDQSLHHTHEGSIGNLCNEKISELMKKEINSFHFEKAEKALADLLK